ncbi:MAG TPA: glycosyltransferase family 1 protein [Solirubrobacteraceae bacterium]|nr:glycosyltransferase family 1 protein [Solirubrobacteraceae bacterium]
MHVGLNLVYLVPGETGGMEVYARELIPRLAAIDGLRLTAFVNREAGRGERGPWHEIAHETVPVKARNRFEWVRGEQQQLPRMAAKAGVDIVHSLASTAPLRGRFVRVTTIHDLNYKLVPDAHFGLLRLGMGVLVPAAARRSQRIIAISRSTAADIERELGVAARKIDVVAQGVGHDDAVPPTPERLLRRSLDLGDRPVLLSVSAKRPHKNLIRLLEAHARLDAGERPVLVLPGYSTPHEAELVARARELGSAADVRFPSWVGQADLEGLYALAAAFVFPSLYEGFGLPVLEAMRRGLPVACSDRSSLPEVVGDAALLFDPDDVGRIEAALRRLLGDAGLRQRLKVAGPERARQFDWDATAAGTLSSYRRALDDARGRAAGR